MFGTWSFLNKKITIITERYPLKAAYILKHNIKFFKKFNEKWSFWLSQLKKHRWTCPKLLPRCQGNKKPINYSNYLTIHQPGKKTECSVRGLDADADLRDEYAVWRVNKKKILK